MAAVAGFFEQGRGLTRDQRNAFIAAFLGWTMDAFDYFLIVFVFKEIADDFGTSIGAVQVATTLTLAARPVGALFFGLLADRFGRRRPLMAAVIFYSAVEFATGFTQSLTGLLILRTLFGIGMGAEWGIGASLAMEKIPVAKRGFFSGLLQQGYAFGYLLAALAYFVIEPIAGWRGLFIFGAVPALLSLFVRKRVGESEAWERTRQKRTTARQVFFDGKVLRRFVYLVALMSAFNFMSHGTQDQYPTFLKDGHGFSADTAVLVAVVYNIGALIGGVTMGALSESFGRKRTVILCAICALPIVPLFALPSALALLMLGAFVMQFFVQGAWGVIPAHLNELSPDEIRGFYPGVTYQLGNLIAAINLPLQTWLAGKVGGSEPDYGMGMLIVMIPVFLAVIFLTAIGPEQRGIEFGRLEEGAEPSGRFAREPASAPEPSSRR
jgi:SHS family lactate transporter-like MFS transporter